jgi:hypothetical protein
MYITDITKIILLQIIISLAPKLCKIRIHTDIELHHCHVCAECFISVKTYFICLSANPYLAIFLVKYTFQLFWL